MILFCFLLVAIPLARVLIRWSLVIAQPDEWLIMVRDGNLVKSGIGITLWRRPGEVVARFSSTVQRVKFSIDVLTHENLSAIVDGFVLWAVSPEGDSPFRAFSKLGIANLNSQRAELRSQKHLLTTPQYHAFQALLEAEVRRCAASLTLNQVLSEPETLLTGLSSGLKGISQGLGIRIEQVEILQARPTDPSMLADLAARHERAVREDATNARLETAERLKQKEISSATRLAQDESRASLERQAYEAQTALDLERARAKLLEEQQVIRRQQLDGDRETRLAEIEVERALSSRREEIARERQAAADEVTMQALHARIEREDLELAAKVRFERTMGLEKEIASLAVPERDAEGITLENAHRPQRVRVSKQGLDNDF